MSWWATKVRRFGRYWTGRVSRAERDGLAGWLSPAQLALFDDMQRADRRHGLDVVGALRAAGHDQPDLLLAGLLHDCAKGRSIRVWHRVAWSLSERYGAGVERVFASLPGFRPAFVTMRGHASSSAEMVLAAGGSALTAELIRNQDEPTDQVLGRALLLADQAN